MTEDQKKVILDYATELQTNDEPWREFEGRGDDQWIGCTFMFNPASCSTGPFWKFRRKSRTITVTMPVLLNFYGNEWDRISLKFKSMADRDTALAAIREAMGVGNE